MILEQLRQFIVSEAQLPHPIANQLRGQVFQLIAEEARLITATVRYSELVDNDTLVFTTPGQSTFELIDEDDLPLYQHIDRTNVRWFATTDQTLPARHLRYNSTFSGPNSGPPYWFRIRGTYLDIYPYADTSVDQVLAITGWFFPLKNTDQLGTEVLPDVLIPLLKPRVLARLSVYTDPKKYGMFKQNAREAKAESLGQVPIADANGRK